MKTPKKKDQVLADILFPSRASDYTDSILDVPPEERRLITETLDFTVKTIVEQLNQGTIFVPEFQRDIVWTRSQKSRLIESLIIQCPIPVIYLNQEDDNSLSIIDGNQRIHALKEFTDNQFELTGLTAYPELEGFRYHSLDPRFKRHIDNRAIRCMIITKDTHPQVKFDVFERLNTGSVKLSPHELRYGIYHGDMIKLCEELSEGDRFIGLMKRGADKRKKFDEYILRYFALRENVSVYKKPLSNFLNEYCKANRKMGSVKIAELKNDFMAVVDAVERLYGNLSFSVITRELKVRSKFNVALFDAQMISLSMMLNEGIPLPSSAKALSAVGTLLSDDQDFRKAVLQATSDDKQVPARISILYEKLKRID